MKKKILITGGAGFLGRTWAKISSSRYDVHITLNRSIQQYKNLTTHWLDLTDENKTLQLVETLKPDIIINTAGLTNIDECEKNPELAYKLNVKTTQNIAKASKASSAKLVHISTDHLFDGTAKLYSEEAKTNPLNEYAKTKGQAEVLVMELDPTALIIRTNFYGKSFSVKKSFTDWLENELRSNHQVKMYTDLYFSPIYINDLIDFTEIALNKNLKGILNITGSERMSKFEFGMVFAEVFNLNQSLISPTTLYDFPKNVIRPNDMSLSPDKFYELTGMKTSSVKDCLIRMKKEMEIMHD